jgi:hypothetical protein
MRAADQGVEAAIGYAVGRRGRGLAYARLTGRGVQNLLRLPFRIARPALRNERVGGYTALTVVARALRDRGIQRVRLLLSDATLVEEISNRRELADALVLPYVRLRCALNTLAGYDVAVGATDDLTQRARAEVALNLAA